ncbi:EAL domain-containing protein [Shewanella violacea]|uniref:EAL domain protein n=1 Tax=Shewanella violacea (strain JCM 10179 / CIP 106290 / LMG 19151 / DSS12) TaxID=637905 RepID=D4ZL25_SHEVD|nr:EAL domain-containing protein [Shewanella violacea]BAJ02374.1 EAL domain protein [Shewanella violacea DSS12]
MLSLDNLYLGAEYQPLISTSDSSVYGYEALSRFTDIYGYHTPPNVVFDHLHNQASLLEQVEIQAKLFQLKHSIESLPLFINLDPHAIGPKSQQMLNLLSLRPNLTVEIIENTCINDAKLSSVLVSHLKSKKIKVALDDIGAPHSMLSLSLLGQVDTLKFDINWLNQVGNIEQEYLMKALIQFAKDCRKQTVLEGVENPQQFALAQELGIDLVQGFLFKSQFITAPSVTQLQPLDDNLSLIAPESTAGLIRYDSYKGDALT